MTLTLPDIKMTEREVKQELALSLYAIRKVNLTQAAEIAAVGRVEFQGMLSGRQIRIMARGIWCRICVVFRAKADNFD